MVFELGLCVMKHLHFAIKSNVSLWKITVSWSMRWCIVERYRCSRGTCYLRVHFCQNGGREEPAACMLISAKMLLPVYQNTRHYLSEARDHRMNCHDKSRCHSLCESNWVAAVLAELRWNSGHKLQFSGYTRGII
jgi:hypothetical protein